MIISNPNQLYFKKRQTNVWRLLCFDSYIIIFYHILNKHSYSRNKNKLIQNNFYSITAMNFSYFFPKTFCVMWSMTQNIFYMLFYKEYMAF